jgi:capsular exopolysaccharide synthesis family protein
MKFLDVDNPPRVIVVTSSVTSEGKSTIVGNLALTMAAAGDPVVVVDGDLRRPRIAAIFNLVPGVGVTNVLSGQAKLTEVLQDWGKLENLSVLGSGPTPPNPSELLGSEAMKQMLKTLSAQATVLIDAPPLLAVTDAAVLSQLADGVIVVARAGSTTRDELAQALGNLRRVNASIVGTIVNCVPTRGVDAYPYYGEYVGEPDDLSSTASETSQSDFSDAVTKIGEGKALARSEHRTGTPADSTGDETDPTANHLEASRH